MGEEHGFELSFRGRLLCEQAVRRVEDGVAPVYQFYWRHHDSKVGKPHESKEEAAQLDLGSDGRPLRYQIFSSKSAVKEARFSPQGVEVMLLDGSSRFLPSERPVDFVLQHNLIVQLALGLHWRQAGAKGPLSFFSPESLRIGQIGATRTPKGWKTDMDISLEVNPDGYPLAVSQESQGNVLTGRPISLRWPDDIRTFSHRHKAGPPELGTEIGTLNELVLGNSPDVSVHTVLWIPSGRRELPRQPVCVFLQGSGALDRFGRAGDVDLGTISLFRALAREGLRVMSVDVRGAGDTSFGSADSNPYDPRMDDALRVIEWLHSNPNTQSAPLVLVGHSLGALLVLWLVSQPISVSPAAIVLLAPPGRRLRRVLLEQINDLQVRTGQVMSRDARLKLVMSLRRYVRAHHDALAAAPWGVGAMMASKLAKLNPCKLSIDRRIPVLICYGEADAQVPFGREGTPLITALGRESNRVEVKVFPGLNHLFQAESADVSNTNVSTEREFNSAAADAVAKWIAIKLADFICSGQNAKRPVGRNRDVEG